MDLNYLKKVLKIFDDSSATVIKIEEEGLKIRISKNDEHYPLLSPTVLPAQAQMISEPAQAAAPTTKENQEAPKQKEKKEDMEVGHKIKSPIVGTFYRAPSPDSPPFVEIGSHINKGETLCIVEAMKLMNEIESDISGVVQKITIENAEPVEYGQTLFIIKPD